jgi:hypothetical protein
MNIVNLDFYNHHYFVRVDNKEYYTTDQNKFAEDMCYALNPLIGALSYEPSRNIYHIEYRDGTQQSGSDLPEFEWFVDNAAAMYSKILESEQRDAFVVTIEMQRAQLLYETDWLVQRHQEQLLRQATPTLDEGQFRALLDYKQELRDLTQHYSKDQPAEIISWPQKPFNF